MPVPTTKVYIGFDLAASGGNLFTLNDTVKGKLDSAYVLGGDVLTDVTQYVASVSVDRGKSRELDRYTAGHASVTLHNDSRIFDPFNTSSIYYSQILPRKPIAIETNGDRVFTGFIDDWDLTYDVSGKSFASVSAVDGFLRLSAAELDSFITTSQLSSDRITAILNRPEVAWPIANRSIETGLTTLQADVVPENTNALQYLQLIETTENGKFFVDSSGIVTFKNRTTVPPTYFPVVFSDELSGDITRTNLVTNPSFETNTTNYNSAQSGGVTRSTDFALTGIASAKITMSSTTDSNAFNLASSAHSYAATGVYTASAYFYIPVGSTLVGRTITLTAEGGTATVSVQSSSPATLVAGQWVRASQRVNCTVIGTKALVWRLSGTLSTAVGQTIYMDSVLEEQSDSLSDYFDGSFFGAQWTGTANASTSLIPLTSYVPYTNIGVVYGSENLYNRVTITRAGSTSPQIADSLASQDKYGVAAYSIDGVLLTSDTEALALAEYLVGLYDEPELRINEVTVVLHDKTPTQVDNLLNIEIADVVNVIFTPNQIGEAINQYAIVTGIKNNIGIDRHELTFELGSVSAFPLILDNPIYGRLGGSLPVYDSTTTAYDAALINYDGSEQFGYVLAY